MIFTTYMIQNYYIYIMWHDKYVVFATYMYMTAIHVHDCIRYTKLHKMLPQQGVLTSYAYQLYINCT